MSAGSSAAAALGMQVNPDGEARCAHRSTWGTVCPACWAAVPFLQDVYGNVYVCTPAELNAGHIYGTVSPATPGGPYVVASLDDEGEGDA